MADERINDGDPRLDEAFAAYMEAAEADQMPKTEDFLGRFPELAGALAAHEALGRLVVPLSGLAATVDCEPDQTEVLPAGTVIEDYEILEEIGRHGQGVVYKARHLKFQYVVALKMLLSGPQATEKEVQRFEMEVNNQAKLDHPNIVPIKGGGEHEGRLYFTMKLIEGGNLTERFAGKPMTFQAKALLTAKIARAVHHAHQRGILHRDLKPSNILLDAEDEPYVADFGLSKRVDTAETTNGAYVVGAAPFVAPEQIRGETTALSDVYGLGTILYWLLTDRPPFGAETRVATLLQVLERDAEPPRAFERHVDRDLEAICMKCLEKEPARRYGSAAGLAMDLERWLASKETSARRWSPAYRAGRWCGRNPLGAGLTATAALLLIAVTTALLLAVEGRQARLQKQGDDFHVAVEKSSLEIANRFSRYEELLEQLRGSAVVVLTRVEPDNDEPVFFADNDLNPPDYPTLVKSPTAIVERKTLQRLMLLRNDFVRAVGRSRRNTIWVYVALEEGVDCTYPGMGGFRDQYDPRDRPWYSAAKNSNGEVVWVGPYHDVLGLGRVLSCTAPIYDYSGRFLGVAGFDLLEEFVRTEILRITPSDHHDAFLVDGRGKVLISGVPGHLPSEVVEDIRTRREGRIKTNDKLISHFRLDGSNWHYVVAAESDHLQDVLASMVHQSDDGE